MSPARAIFASAIACGFALTACSLFVSTDQLSDGTTRGPDGGDAEPNVGIGSLPNAAAPAEAGGDAGTTTAISFVQAAPANGGTARSVTVTLGRPVTEGNTVIVAGSVDDHCNVDSIRDDAGSVFYPVDSFHPGFDVQGFVFAAFGAKAATQITVSVDCGPTYLPVYALEYSGIATSSALVAAQGTSGTRDGGPAMQASVTAVDEGTLLFAYGLALTLSGQGTVATGDGFTARQTDFSGLVEDRIVGPGPAIALETLTAGSDWGLAAAAFKPAR
jgi:hypothetical protein